MAHTKEHRRKQQTGSGAARRTAEDVDSRRQAVDRAVEAAVEGKDASGAKNKEVKKRRKKARQQDKANPSIIQQVLDAVFG